MSQANPASLGIDVAKATFDAALLIDGQLHQRSFAMTVSGFDALHAWMSKQRVERIHACLEATGEYGAALALSLYEAGHVVSIVNPARIAAYAKSRLGRTKTDKADAALIAHFCCTQRPLAWAPPPAEVRELQARVRRVEMLQEMAQQEVNRLQSGLHSPAVRAFTERLQARGKHPMVIVGAAMRKLVHLLYGVLKSGKPFDPALAMEA